MDGQLTEQEKGRRSDILLLLHEKRAAEYEKAMLGRELEVLLEEEICVEQETYLVGHSREYVRAAVKKQEGIAVNDIVTMVPQSFLEKHTLLGEVKFSL